MSLPNTPGLTPAELRRRAAQYRHAAAQRVRDADRLMDEADAYVDKAISFEATADAQDRMTERGAVR